MFARTLHIDDKTQIENLSWFMHIRRLHDRLDDVYNPGPQLDEWNNPHTDYLWRFSSV